MPASVAPCMREAKRGRVAISQRAPSHDWTSSSSPPPVHAQLESSASSARASWPSAPARSATCPPCSVARTCAAPSMTPAWAANRIDSGAPSMSACSRMPDIAQRSPSCARKRSTARHPATGAGAWLGPRSDTRQPCSRPNAASSQSSSRAEIAGGQSTPSRRASSSRGASKRSIASAGGLSSRSSRPATSASARASGSEPGIHQPPASRRRTISAGSRRGPTNSSSNTGWCRPGPSSTPTMCRSANASRSERATPRPDGPLQWTVVTGSCGCPRRSRRRRSR